LLRQPPSAARPASVDGRNRQQHRRMLQQFRPTLSVSMLNLRLQLQDARPRGSRFGTGALRENKQALAKVSLLLVLSNNFFSKYYYTLYKS
jgi:hypothetical protein